MFIKAALITSSEVVIFGILKFKGRKIYDSDPECTFTGRFSLRPRFKATIWDASDVVYILEKK